MSIERGVFLEVLKDSYSAYYTIVENVETELPLVFRADYRSRDEQYFLTKSAKIWGNEKNECAYIFSAPTMDKELVQRCLDYAWEDLLPRVKPHKEHQCTNAKVIFVVDSLDEETIKAVKKDNRTKSYKLGLQGYSNLMAGAVSLNDRKTYTNRSGSELTAYFKKLFAAREEKD